MTETEKYSQAIKIPDYARKAVHILEEGGYEAWLVGGFVRDALRGREANDIDIATSALWEQGKKLFEAAGCKVFETGTKHGTITVGIDREVLEVTTYRSEGGYSDNRHPDRVVFHESIENDLARRDFTINAIAYHPERGLRDPYKGWGDIRSRYIRTVGNPETRFSEDALRILRAARFASQLGFSIDDPTACAMKSQKGLLDTIAVERIAHELDCFVYGDHVYSALMENIDVIGQVIPEALPMVGFYQKTPYHIYDVFEHTAYCLHYCPPTKLLRWAAFFHDIGKPNAFFTDENGRGHFYGHAKISVDIASKVMKRLRFPTTLSHRILLLVRYHDDVIKPSAKAVKRMLRKLDEDPELFRALCALKKADALSQAPHCHNRVELADDLEAILERILAENEIFSLKDLSVDGNNLLALGISAGPEIGSLLKDALDAVIDGKVPNDREALLSYIHSLHSKRHLLD